MLILTWIGAVLALSLLLIMALGPAIVEIDSWWYERKHAKRLAGQRSCTCTTRSSGEDRMSRSQNRLRTQVPAENSAV